MAHYDTFRELSADYDTGSKEFNILRLYLSGKLYTLEPQDDLTPIELFNIIQFKEYFVNYNTSSVKLLNKIYDLKIERHFSIKEK